MVCTNVSDPSVDNEFEIMRLHMEGVEGGYKDVRQLLEDISVLHSVNESLVN